MAATATLGYSAHHALVAGHDTHQQSTDDQYLSTFFCRALYDYQSPDASSLSFYRGDIIEVLTQLESGWWDGLLNDERGWFPSNYVQPISEQEAEAELLGSEYGYVRGDGQSIAGESQLFGRSDQSGRGDQWYADELDYSDGGTGAMGGLTSSSTQSNDFWVPQVTQNGQIYYVNTHTGEHSRDLPAEGDEEDAQPPIPSSSSSGLPNQRPGMAPTTPVSAFQAGFGVERRGGTPEPWIKRLADDGMTYYYHNKTDGRVQWTRPEAQGHPRSLGNSHQSSQPSSSLLPPSTSPAPVGPFESLRIRSESATSLPFSTTSASSKRLSVYSDDSEIHPRDLDKSTRNGHPANQNHEEDSRGVLVEDSAQDLTSAEESAMLLQEALAPGEADTIDSLAETFREATVCILRSVGASTVAPKGDNSGDVEKSVNDVVVAVRNLLYISCALVGPSPSTASDQSTEDLTATAQQMQAQLKTSQRKVTATLSKLVLSVRAARSKRESMSAEMTLRIEQDAADLQRAVDGFLVEVQRQQERTENTQMNLRVGRKRLRGVLGPNGVGLGLPGAGHGGFWKGFGFVQLDSETQLSKRRLDVETVNELKLLGVLADSRLARLASSLSSSTSEDVVLSAQEALTQIWAFLSLLADINVAHHVDVDGIRRGGQKSTPADDDYTDAVIRGRYLLRDLESTMQALCDDGASILLALQTISSLRGTQDRLDDLTHAITPARANLKHLQGITDDLLTLGSTQAGLAKTHHSGSIEWRMSRLSILNGRRLSNFFGSFPENRFEEEDVVDMEAALRAANTRPTFTNAPSTDVTVETKPEPLELLDDLGTPSGTSFLSSKPSTGTPQIEQLPGLDDDVGSMIVGKSKAPPRAAKIRQLLGDDAPETYIDNANADKKPWYLRSTYTREEILINPDGGVRAGTLPALVDRLTTHEHGDPSFIKTFLLTYKSFTTLDETFDLLVKRYRMEPPDGLKQDELQEWTKLKQAVVRIRVLNTFKTMLTDKDVLEKEDMYILDRMKQFCLCSDVSNLPAAKILLSLIDRAQTGGDAVVRTTAVQPSFPPPSIAPKASSSRKFKLLDIDPLEMARQLTILESRFYNKIRPVECLQRAREQRSGENQDHITDVIQITNKIANWVADSVLGKDDSRKRAAIVKQFIAIADRCRTLNNFSSMVAIISGLNSPPIRRLKRTWEQVNGRLMSQLGTCEMTLDSTKNFTNYRATLAKVNPPCVPFIGVYLTTLTFIQDGAKDNLPGNMINFTKRQKAAEVIREIKHWQSKPFNLNPLPMVLSYIEESLGAFNETTDWSDFFWNLSLEREPREREDEKMARLLQESGFL